MARNVECTERSTFESLTVRSFVGGGGPFSLHVEAFERGGACVGTAQLDKRGARLLAQAILTELGAGDIASDLDFLSEEE